MHHLRVVVYVIHVVEVLGVEASQKLVVAESYELILVVLQVLLADRLL